ncbi:hypothetical protein OPQ81_002190 [Rhizoctonia solani]|nr:hypothetical protein OPQ81_002190 [Rhizoctonia solani]
MSPLSAISSLSGTQSRQIAQSSLSPSPAPSATSVGTTVSHASNASILAANPRNFRIWARAVNLNPNIWENIPADDVFEPIRKLQAASAKYPLWLTNENSPQFKYIPKKYYRERDVLCYEAKVDIDTNAASYAEDEDQDLCAAIPMIFQSYHHHLAVLDFPDHATEMDMRVGMDNIISHIYDVEDTKYAEYWMEHNLKLPANRSFNIAATTTDGFSFFILDKHPTYGRTPQVRRAMTAYGGTGGSKNLLVVHCVVEYKRSSSGANQAMMGLVSGLYQRKALDQRDHFVFGMFQYDTDSFTVVAAIWRKDDPEIQVYTIGEYSLESPITTVQLYLVLRGIKDLARTYHEEIEKSWKALSRTVSIVAPKVEWVRKPMGSTRENAGDSKAPNDSNGLDQAVEDENLEDDEEPEGLFESMQLEPATPAGIQHQFATAEEWVRYSRTYEFVREVRSNPPESPSFHMDFRSGHTADASAE